MWESTGDDQKARPRWLGHVERKIGHRNIEDQNWVGATVQKDMEDKGVQREEAQDRRTWRMKP